MLNIVEMINANLNVPLSKLPDLDRWNELGDDGQNLLASLALGLSNEKMSALREQAANDFPEEADEIVWHELKAYESLRNKGLSGVEIPLLDKTAR